MKISIKIESIEHPRFNEYASIRNALEKDIENLFAKQDYGGESVSNCFLVVIRIYPKQRFVEYPDIYKPVFQFNKKRKNIAVSHNLSLEELENNSNEDIWSTFKNVVVICLEKLKEKKVTDINTIMLLNEFKVLGNHNL